MPLTHHAEHAVVKNDGNNRQIVADRRAGFVEIHMERAVARDMYHALFGESKLRTDCRTVAVPHRTESAACQEIARARMVNILRRPHLVLTDVRDINGFFICSLTNCTHQFVRCNAVGVVLRDIILFFIGFKCFNPRTAVCGFYKRQERRQNRLYIARQIRVHHHVFIDFAQVNINLHDLGFLCKTLGVERHTVGKPRADSDKQIGFVNRLIGHKTAVHTDQTVIQRFIVAQNACRH